MGTILNSEVISEYLSQESIDSYKRDFDNWVSEFNMTQYLGPADHFAIKVKNEAELEKVVEAFKPYCVGKQGDTPGLSVRTMHGRRIAVALLKNPLKFGNELINCIEIMQHRPEVEGGDVVGFDHCEIINANLEAIENSLKDTKANYYVDETNPYKNIVVSFINNRKERIKFTNKTLAEIVPIQIADEPERVKVIINAI